MRLLVSLLLCTSVTAAADGWDRILSSVGLAGKAKVITEALDCRTRIERGEYLVVQGGSPAALSCGFIPGSRRVAVTSILDARAPKLPIVWQQPAELAVFQVPEGATIFATERRTGAPVVAGLRRGKGAVLWIATPPGDLGYERYPYLAQALVDLGLKPEFHSRRLWAFFDTSYRSRIDPEYFARRWRNAGIAALHVAAWHYQEEDTSLDDYLRKLIEACHRNAILVYAWLELPHVSEKFWNDHPEWREKTAIGQDAHLDWRKLMNLQNRDCFQAVSKGIRELIGRFDWDGVNLAELYFESLEGIDNPARFTPMNEDVRRAFQRRSGIDPISLPGGKSPSGQKDFLAWRADLARTMQAEWIAEVEKIRQSRRDLDLVLTHVDDRLDTNMRSLIGADAARVLPMLERHDFTFLIEDPATVWHLGPERYSDIAARYRTLTKRQENLAIDINIVERYQDVYPTKQQTGSELFQLVQFSSRAFPRVALYFENSILEPDWLLLPAAAAVAAGSRQPDGQRVVESARGVGVTQQGPALLDGKPWPARSDELAWVPPGRHSLGPAKSDPPVRLLDLNADLLHAAVAPQGLEFRYSASARAIALLDKPVVRVMIDGRESPLKGTTLLLPKGRHTVTAHLR